MVDLLVLSTHGILIVIQPQNLQSCFVQLLFLFDEFELLLGQLVTYLTILFAQVFRKAFNLLQLPALVSLFLQQFFVLRGHGLMPDAQSQVHHALSHRIQ